MESRIECQLVGGGLVPIDSTRLLVSSGAHSLAERQKIPLVEAEDLISERTTREWKFWRKRVTEADGRASAGSEGLEDTVGAVAFCWEGEADAVKITTAAGVSR